MKVLHVIPSMARRSGGPAEVVRQVLPALKNLGVEVSLITTDKEQREGAEEYLPGVPTTVAHAIADRWTFAPRLIPAVWAALRSADIIHIHSVHTFPSTIAMLLARIRRVPVILQPHGALNRYHLDQHRFLKTAYFKIVDRVGLKSVKFGLYSSEVETHDAELAIRAVPRWLPLGVDDELLSVERIASDVPSIVFLSRIASKKRIDLFLRALATDEMSTLSWAAVVAGPIDADLNFDPIRMRDDLGLRGRVRFVGAVDADARVEILRRASIFALPSDDESFGMAAAEAMAGGCAVVATPGVGAAVDASEHEAVLIVDQNAEAFSSAISRLLLSPDLADAYGEKGRDYARRNLLWSSIAGRLQSYYAEALELKERSVA